MILFLLGVLVWTLVEYGVHYALHVIPVASHFTGHHTRPHDYTIGPSWFDVLGLALVLWLLCFAVGALWFAGGFSLGYVWYAWLHYACHHDMARVPSYLRRLHSIHHGSSSDKNYGVTSPVWDMLFGTYKKPARVPHQAC